MEPLLKKPSDHRQEAADERRKRALMKHYNISGWDDNDPNTEVQANADYERVLNDKTMSEKDKGLLYDAVGMYPYPPKKK